MKILWVTSGYPWSGNPYAGIFYQTQAQALARLGAEVAVEAAVPWVPAPLAWVSPRHAKARSAPRVQQEGELRIHRLACLAYRGQDDLGWPHGILAFQLLRHLPFRPDLVHGHFATPMGLAAVMVGRRLGIPSVITLHGSDVNFDPGKSRLSARAFQAAIRGADHLLSVSRALGDRTRLLTGRTAQCLPIGVNLQRFDLDLDRASARNRLGLPQDRPIILFIGNLLASKGVEVALEALAHPDLAHALGVFVGAGPLGGRLKGQPNLHPAGSVPNPEIVPYLKAADLLVLPSFGEGLPTVLVEAGAAGLPVLATPVGGIPDLLAEDRGVLVPVGDAAALRQAILATLDDPEGARARAGRLQAHVRNVYDADANARTLRGLYADLIQRRAQQPA
jgi:teichuronic acid biosynthesis glycosyltransferase TuaC